MSRSRRRFGSTLALCLALGGIATPAAAEWKRAQTDRFVVYSEDSEVALRRFVTKLQTFDFIIRKRLSLPEEAPPRPLPIYLVRNNDELQQVFPGAMGVGGVYVASEEDIFAVARSDIFDDILFHEYLHHLTIQTGGLTDYPTWLVEGLAEYFATTEVREGEVRMGGYNDHRTYWLTRTRSWTPLSDLLTKHPAELDSVWHQALFYPLSWMLTHWFLNTPERRPMLATYIRDVQAGGDPAEAMTRATGMDLPSLKRELIRYGRQPVNVAIYRFEQPSFEVTITRLPRSADALLLLGQALATNAGKESAETTLERVRRQAARFPTDPMALRLLGHAELQHGDAAAGEAALERLLATQADDVAALQLMGQRRLVQAREAASGPEKLALVRQSRVYLSHAYEIDPIDFHTLHLLALTRSLSANYPNENDLLTWESAYLLAPQLITIRFGYARALMLVGRNDEAVAMLHPVANSPHAKTAAEVARQMIERAQAGQPPLDDAVLEAAARARDDPKKEPKPEDGEDGEGGDEGEDGGDADGQS